MDRWPNRSAAFRMLLADAMELEPRSGWAEFRQSQPPSRDAESWQYSAGCDFQRHLPWVHDATRRKCLISATAPTSELLVLASRRLDLSSIELV
jgi:hypothetical protein